MRRALLLSVAVAFSFAAHGAAQSPKPNSRQPEAQPAPASARTAGPAGAQAARVSFSKLPLSFEENRGQADARVKYVSRGPGYSLFLTSDQAVLALRSGSGTASCIRPDRRMDRLCAAAEKADSANNGSQDSVLWLRMLGASGSAQVVGSDELPGKINYYVGNDPSKWRAGVPLFARVTYRGVYPGVDLTYYGNQYQLESDYVVAPGANPRNIEFEVAGAKQTRLDADGNLILTTSAGSVRLLRPGVYQTIRGQRHSVAGSYVLRGENRVGFQIGAYDTRTTLVIDPTLVYATYLGGSASFGPDNAEAIREDSTGVYVTGAGTSSDFPGSDSNGPLTPSSDGFAFITKFDPTGGTLLYSTLLSGTDGFDTSANGIGVDGAQKAYIAGVTTSTNFPTLNPFQATYGSGLQTAFVAGLNSDGTLAYSTYFGGRNEDDESEGMGLYADATGNAYVVGDTNSENFPTLDALATSPGLSAAGATNVFAAKFNATGQLIYSTYLAGTGFEEDQGNAIVADTLGNAYVTGDTDSATFPVAPATTAFQKALAGSENVFITKLGFSSSTLTIEGSTYLGGASTDIGMGIAVDSASTPNIYVTGSTTSSGAAPSGFPTKNPLFTANGGGTDAFITKLTGDFTALVFSTYLGGAGSDTGFAISLDTASPPNVYVAGSTSSANFPLGSPLQATLGTTTSNTNAFVTALNGAGKPLIYSTYLGGNGSDEAHGIFSDATGNVYVAGETTSQNFPVQGLGAGAPFQGVLGSTEGNAFVAKISPTAAPAGLNFFPSSFNFQSAGLSQPSFKEAATLSNNSNAAVTITGSGISVGGTNPSDFSQTNTCGTSIAAGASCTVTVTFSPTVQDIRTAQINVTSTASSNGTLMLSGFGAVPEISLSATTLNFGTADPLNVQAFSGVEITNTGGTGGVALQVGSFQIQGTGAAAFTVESPCGTLPATLTPGSGCDAEIAFTPTTAGPYTATLLINDNAAGSPQMVTLTGTGAALVNVGPSSEEFGPVLLGAQSTDGSYTVTNGSGSALTVSSIVKGGSNPGDYIVDTATSTCNSAASFQLVAGGTCTLEVFFQPTAASAIDGRTATFTFNYSSTAVTGSKTVNAMGTGETGVTLYQSTASASEYVGLTTSTNGGDILFNGTVNPITITSIVLTGDNATDYTVQIDPNCAAFTNGVIAANSRCNVGGTFTPSAVGPRTATATINYTGSGTTPSGSLVVALNGTGLLYPVQFPFNYDFGSEIVNTTAPTHRFEYQNASKVPVTISAITPPANADFQIADQTCVVGTLPGGSECHIDMNFTPRHSPTFQESDTLTITDNSNSLGTQQPRTLSLKGTSVPAAVTVSANPVDFGNAIVGKTAKASFFLTNAGGSSVTISVAPALTTATGTPFALVTGQAGECALSTVVLGSGGTCSVILTFTPAATGFVSNSITLTDSTGGLHTVTIQGTGVDQGIAGLSPSSLTYTQAAGTTGAAQSALLTNTGNGPMTVTSISIFNESGTAFAVAAPATNPCTVGLVLAANPGPGNTCNVAATFTTPASGTATSFFGELEVNTNLGNGATSTNSTFLEGTVSTTGTGSGFSLSPAGPIAFGTAAVGTMNTSTFYTLTNNNSVPVTFTSMAFQTATTQYTIPFLPFPEGCLGGPISANGGQCFFEVTFAPTSPTVQNNFLQFTYANATGLPPSPFSVSVTGTGSNAVVVNPNPVAFGSVSLASGSTQIQVTISDGAAQTATINSVSAITGAGAAALSFSFNECSNGTLLTASGGQCSLGVNYVPTAGGANGAASFTVNYTPSGGSATNIVVPITASATAPVAVVTTPASGAALVFPSQSVNTQSQVMNVVVTNQGTDNLGSFVLQISGNDFSLAATTGTACSFASLAPRQSCTIPIAFTPSASGARTGTLTITDNSVPTKTQTVALQGTGAGGSVTVSPTTFNFPQTNIGSSVTQAAVVYNTTGSPVTFTGVSYTNGAYTTDTTQTANACVNGQAVPAITGTCAVYIKFTPSALTNAGQAQVTTSASGTALMVALSGAGFNTNAPVVTTNPLAQTVSAGSSVTFTAAATGTPSPTVQWQVSINGGAFSNVPGATSTSLTFSATAAENGNQYQAVFTNASGAATTTAATLTVNFAATITTNPTSQTITAGNSVTFVAAASGNPTPTVQWQVSSNGGAFGNIGGATSTTLTFTTTAAQNGNQYQAVFTNSVGSGTTTAALLTVNSAPVVTTNPTNQGVTAGNSVTFTAAAIGNPAPTVQWQVSSNGGAFSNVTGATSTTLTFSATAAENGNQYQAVFTNSAGSAPTTAATLTVGFAPTITTSPTSQTITAGNSVTFTAAASGNPAPTVQWQVSSNGGAFSNIAGATSTTLTFPTTAAQNGNQYQAVFTNAIGPATTTAATLTVNFAPAITTSPTSQTITAGGSVTFTAAASGNPAPTVQWQVSISGGAFSNIAGATSTTLTFTTAAAQSGNQYQAVFTNSISSATTTAATLTVNTVPAITTSPISQTITAGGSVTFTAAASGSPAPTVQWQVSSNGGAFSNVTGATSTTLTFTTTAAQNGNKYQAIFTNAAGSATTTAATLTVNFAPAITTSPTIQTITAGNSVTFTAAASGNPTPTVQWQVSSNGGAFSSVPGATSTTLTFTTAAAQNGNQYQAVFTNTVGSATTTAATLTVNFAPTISTNPTNQSVVAGNTATFTAAASGNPTPTVQWQVSSNGGAFSNLPGATSASLPITSTTTAESGNQYQAVFTNSVGSVTTTAATLTVAAAPSIPVVTSSPTSQTITAGNSATFTAAANGVPTPTVQWQVSSNGGAFSNIAGAISATLTFPATAAENGNQYQAVFTNSQGSATTTPAVLSVDFAPTITTSPTSQTIAAGNSVTFTAAASGNPAPTVQWQVSSNGGAFSNIAGATSTTLTFVTTAAENGNQYQAVFTNAIGPATTTAATLTVNFAPTITTSPTSQTITAGNSVTFTAAASGNPTPTVQWQVSSGGPFGNLAGATSTTLSFPTTAAQNGNQYQAVFTNSISSATATAATLTVNTVPAITTSPTSQTITAGNTATFTAAASGNPTPTVQWQVSSNGGAFSNIAGATSTTLTFATTAAQNGNKYQAIFTNAAGSATTTAATLTVNFAPTVTTSPTSQTITAGNSVTFTAAASGNPTPTVQWQVSSNGGAFSNVPGATSTALTFPTTAAQNGNQYQAVFTNTVGSATTAPASLTVNTVPTITTSPTSQTITAGGSVTFTAAASGNPTPTAQWQVSSNGGAFTNVAGATSTTLTFPTTAAQNGNQYQAMFTNLAGSTTTTAATLTVNFTPTITTSPASQTITAGNSVTFTAAASGNPTPTVQWQVSSNGGAFSNVPGATSTTLTFVTTAAQNGNQYQAVFTNSISSATTTAATLTIDFPPAITTNPTSQTITAGGSVTFTAAASGNPTPTVQWQVSSNGGAFTNVAGATSTTLTFTTTAAQNGNKYQAAFTNTVATTTTTAAVLTIHSPDLTISSTHTGDFTVNANGTYTIKVTNSGTAATNGTITVSDALPAGLTFVAAGSGGSGFVCSASGQTVTCTNSTTSIANGANSSFPVLASVAPAAFPSVTNTPTVSDPNDSGTTDKSSAPDTTQIDNAAPTQSGFLPSLGLIAGATTAQPVTLTGTGFNGSTSVTFGTNQPLTGTANAAGTSLTITVPVVDLATAANVTVSVSNPKNPTSNNGGGSAPTTQTFPLVGFSVQVQTGTPNPVPVTAGTSATVQINLPITPANTPLPAAVTITCTVPAGLTGATCLPSPSSIAQGAMSGSSTVTINAVAMKSSQAPPGSGGPGPWTQYLLWFAALAFAAMAGILATSRPRALQTHRGPAYATLLLLVLTAAALAGCASSNSNSGPTPTPTGPSSVTVTATGADGATSSVTVPINVSN